MMLLIVFIPPEVNPRSRHRSVTAKRYRISSRRSRKRPRLAGRSVPAPLRLDLIDLRGHRGAEPLGDLPGLTERAEHVTAQDLVDVGFGIAVAEQLVFPTCGIATIAPDWDS
jgi:hypothetical protein